MARKTKNFILDIVPLTKMPLTRSQSFSYLSEKEWPVGTLVSVPLFRRTVEGIVLGVRRDFERLGNIELKKIEKVLEESFLTEKQIRLAQFLSDYYISPLGVVMKNFVVKRVMARKKYLVFSMPYLVSEKDKIKLTKEQQLAVNKIAIQNTKYKIQNTKHLLFGPSGSGKTEVYIHAILEIKKKKKNAQFLILLPEKTLTPQALERYGQYFPIEEIALLSSNISKGQFYGNWQRVASGQAKIIIGTRMAVFAPFQKLRLIVIDEEQDMSHKQWDMNPRYDARTVAEELAEMFCCPLVRGSATPAVETYYRAMQNEYQLLQLPQLVLERVDKMQDTRCNDQTKNQIPKSKVQLEEKIPNAKYQAPDTILVDMKKERWAKNFSCISKKLKSEIAYTLKYGQQVVLFINRQGMSSFSVCKSCKTVLKCPKCERALAYDVKSYYRCLHCAYKTSITPQCKKCNNIIFENVGLGTQKVEREVKSFFPNARVARLDSQIIVDGKMQAKIYQEFSAGKIDILVGTQMITKGWDLPSVALVGIIDTDNALAIPDFSTGEKFYENLVQVSGRVGRPGAKFPGSVVIQTYQPENQFIKFAAERNYVGFFQAEIAERKVLSFPPFGKLIKLVYQEYDAKKVEEESRRISVVLQDIPGVRVSEAQESFVPRIRGRFRRQIVIKCKDGTIPEKLAVELKKLGTGWIIDVDPVSIT